MRPFRRLFVLSLCTFVAGVAAASETGRAVDASEPVFGYLDPETNIFTPAPREARQSSALAVTPNADPVVVRGTLIVTVSIGLGASLPANASLQASVTATTKPPAGADPAYTSVSFGSALVVRSGATGTAVISIPYAWNVNGPTDTVAMETTISASNGDFASSTQTLALPANGATTNVLVRQRFGG